MNPSILSIRRVCFAVIGVLSFSGWLFAQSDRIEICKQNPRYWQYKGKPVVLIGGSVEDNLFQIPNLKEHLDLLQSVGGNYVRNSMSSRDPGNVWPFKKLDSGKYDLDQWDEEYWKRFSDFLKWTHERDIIVQIEVWETFDFYMQYWEVNPMNPGNNITYTAEETGLPVKVDSHPTQRKNNFFWSIPNERNQKTVLKYQQKFVDKMLSHSLRYGHVLYCMDNETAVTPEWGWYWARYIQDKARQRNLVVHTTEMWDAWDLSSPQHNATFDHPEIYSFVDISQNNHQKGQAHWINAQKQYARIADKPRPLNNVKIYGGDGGRFGNRQDGLERFWRNIFGGLAAARFHRPDSGVGLSPIAQAHLKSMRMLLDRLDMVSARPDSQFALLSDRSENEAYASIIPGERIAVYFPAKGSVTVDISGLPGKISIRWLDIAKSVWLPETTLSADKTIPLSTPGDGHWAVLISAQP
ncbi:MAG: hypothetical protein GX455_05375 [Phycisphaerae bacterium]|nr:hypothetical protein [Phycisphaerae bacterium]